MVQTEQLYPSNNMFILGGSIQKPTVPLENYARAKSEKSSIGAECGGRSWYHHTISI